jgi:hypothetical protein
MSFSWGGASYENARSSLNVRPSLSGSQHNILLRGCVFSPEFLVSATGSDVPLKGLWC